MAEIRVADTELEIEESSYMHGMIDLRIKRSDPYATLTPTQARQVAMTLIAEADRADGFE